MLGAHFNSSDLTEEEKRQYEKITQLREKREKMASNKKWRNEKENREETLQKLENQIESLEQTLYDKYVWRSDLSVAWSVVATRRDTSAGCASASWTRRTATTTGRSASGRRPCSRRRARY